MKNQSLAARVGAEIRRQMDDPQWGWQYRKLDGLPGVEKLAVHRLQSERRRAQRWLALASQWLNLDLPLGNGLSGSWNMTAVLDSEDRLGLCDIARGRIAWTDTTVPSYVRRFAAPTGGGRSTSANPAGGSGSLGSAAAQVVVRIILDASPPRISPRPRPAVRWVEWGLQTCYGTCGQAGSADRFHTEWADIDAEWRETETAQDHEFRCAHERAVRAFVGSLVRTDLAQRVYIGRPGAGCETDRTIMVRGRGDRRRKDLDALEALYRAWAVRWARQEAATAMRDALAQAGADGESLGLVAPGGLGWRRWQEWDTRRVDVQDEFLRVGK